MRNFTVIIINGVESIIDNGKSVDYTPSEEVVDVIMVTGHLSTQDVIELPETKEVLEEVALGTSLLFTIDSMVYKAGSDSPNSTEELIYVTNNFDVLTEQGIVSLESSDVFIVEIKGNLQPAILH